MTFYFHLKITEIDRLVMSCVIVKYSWIFWEPLLRGEGTFFWKQKIYIIMVISFSVFNASAFFNIFLHAITVNELLTWYFCLFWSVFLFHLNYFFFDLFFSWQSVFMLIKHFLKCSYLHIWPETQCVMKIIDLTLRDN